MSKSTGDFLQRLAKHINGSPSCDALLPALLQIRGKYLENLKQVTNTDVKVDGNLGCSWCLNSWSLGQYSVRLLPQKRPRGFRSLRSKFYAVPNQPTTGKKIRKNIGHNFLSLKCDVCLGITKVPLLKPAKPPKPAKESLPKEPLEKKKKKSKKRDNFAGLEPTAVQSAQKPTPSNPTTDCTEKQVLNVFEVLSPSSIQNGVNIVSNRSTKNKSKLSSSSAEKSIIKRIPPAHPTSKTTSVSNNNKNKKNKLRSGHVEKPKKAKNVSSAIASFLNSL